MNLMTRTMLSQAALNQMAKIPGGIADLRKWQKQIAEQRTDMEQQVKLADEILYRIGAALGEVEG